jgi:hypothetical protein
MAKKKKEEPKAQYRSVDNPAIEKIRKVFFSDSIDSVRQGLSIIETLQDPEVYQYFLSSIDYPPDLSLSFIIENPDWKVFMETFNPPRSYLNTMILGLLNAAPEDLPVPLVKRRNEVVRIDFNAVEEIIGELNFPGLREAILYGSGLTHLDSMQKLALNRLFIQDAPELVSISGIEPVTTLEDLELSGMPQITEIRLSDSLKTLKQVNIHLCRKLKTFQILTPSVETLNLSGFRALQDLDLRACRSLKSLTLSNCDNLQSITGLSGLNLDNFTLNRCPKLARIEGLENAVIKSGKISYLPSPVFSLFDRFAGLERVE